MNRVCCVISCKSIYDINDCKNSNRGSQQQFGNVEKVQWYVSIAAFLDIVNLE